MFREGEPAKRAALKTNTRTSQEFLNHVFDLRLRLAVFDCDGTLWANNSGEDFFYWSMERPHQLVTDEVVTWAKARYAAYENGNVDEVTMCGEMTSMYAGLSVERMEAAAKEFFAEVIKPNYFPEMRELTLALKDSGCDLWAVSSTNEWVVKEGVKDFGIPQHQVLAAKVVCQKGKATNEIVRVPSGRFKATAIKELIQLSGDTPSIDAVFGNSIHDAAMLKVAMHAFAVNPNPDLEQLAQQSGWTIYWPEAKR